MHQSSELFIKKNLDSFNCSEKLKRKIVLTIETGEVGPVQQRRVEGRDGGDVEEQVGSVGGITDGIGEEIHL